jgi:hypothetical protein
VRADARFAQLDTIFELGWLMVATKKHLGIPLVHRLLKLVLVLPIATASAETPAMKNVKAVLRNRIGYGFMNNRAISFVEQEFLDAIPNDDGVVRFSKYG